LLAREQAGIVRRYYVTPPEVSEIGDAEARYYAIMRFAVPTDVAWIVTASPATPLKLARAAANHAERLIRDVRDGTLRPPHDIPRTIAASLGARLHPDPQSAQRLGACISREGALLPKDYWKMSFLGNWTGGTLALHLREFPAFFGNTPVREIGLLATEGRVSIGIGSGGASGLMDPGAGFFEFAEKDSQNGTNVWRCHELEAGGEYRVIMTTAAGLYRYDIGDCVRVTGYLGQAPLLEFLHRGTRVSSLSGEKLTEWQVTKAMDRVAAELGLRSSHFMLAPAWGDPPYYRLHVDQRKAELNGLGQLFDRELRRFNMEYAGKRESGRLGCVDVNVLSEGVLLRWEEHCMQRHRAGEQYKHQYLLTEPDQDGELMEMNHESEKLASITMGRPTEMEAGRAFP